jgi:hypothetical protein
MKGLPVTIEASSEARKSAALAMSSGWLSRPSGTVARYRVMPSSSSSFLPMKVGSMGVSVATGAITTTRTPNGASSSARLWPKVVTAPLDAA